jgi:hypothetical protein
VVSPVGSWDMLASKLFVEEAAKFRFARLDLLPTTQGF